jgi:DNA-binding NarL/FixJ family response regulator
MLLVDDHRMFTQALHGLLAGESGIEPAGVAASVEEALAQLDDARPDVVLMDIDLPGASGIEGTREIRRRRPETAVVIVTSHGDPALVTGAIHAGACGYVLKTRAVDELVSIIRQAAAGGMVLSLANVPEAIGEARTSRAVARRGLEAGHRLTDREMDVLRELAGGRTHRSDRRFAVHQRAHGAQPREEHPREARRALQARGRHVRARPWPDRGQPPGLNHRSVSAADRCRDIGLSTYGIALTERPPRVLRYARTRTEFPATTKPRIERRNAGWRRCPGKACNSLIWDGSMRSSRSARAS